MEYKQNKLSNAEVFKLVPGDVDHLFRRSGAAGNQLAVFQYNAQQAAVSSPSPWFKALAESSLCQKIGRQLLEPDIRVMFHTGGNTAAEDKYYVMLSREDQSVLAQLVNVEGHILLLYFPDQQSFVQWWTSVYAATGMEDYPAVFAGLQETEVLICALHSVDLYRRFYLESMLEYRGLVDLSVTTANYVELLKKSLASGDKRWLLPTMFELTPGLRGSKIALKPEHLKKLEEAGFVTSQEEVLTLAERSRLMGTEFIGPWMSSTGWQATALVQGQVKNLSRVFLAATAFSNHLFSFETGPEGQTRFSHQALTGYELAGQMTNWVAALTQAGGTDTAKNQEGAEQAAKARFCGQCGAELKPGKKFCTKCGTPI